MLRISGVARRGAKWASAPRHFFNTSQAPLNCFGGGGLKFPTEASKGLEKKGKKGEKEGKIIENCRF